MIMNGELEKLRKEEIVVYSNGVRESIRCQVGPLSPQHDAPSGCGWR
jgi:hypothetical protein